MDGLFAKQCKPGCKHWQTLTAWIKDLLTSTVTQCFTHLTPAGSVHAVWCPDCRQKWHKANFFLPLICDSDLFLVQWRQHKSHAIRLFFSSSDLGWFHMRPKHRSYVLQCDLSFNSNTENHVTLWPVCLAQGVSCRVSNPKPDALLSVNIIATQTATTVLCLVAIWHAIMKININTTYWLVQRYFFCEIKFNVWWDVIAASGFLIMLTQ